MKLIASRKQLGEAPEMWLRHAGYAFIPDREAGQPSFARRLTRDFYPRYHIYFIETKNAAGEEIVTFNLHLDQKKPGYAGFNRHNAEYDGDAIDREVERLKSFIVPSIFE